MGGSNGGLLVGACMTQRPDLFKVAIPQVGVMDMLRFQKITVGWGWGDEYGVSDKKEDFAWLDHDDRVVPAHSFKFAAELQEKTGGEAALIRIETRGGHGAGKPTAMVIEEWADIWAFLARALDFEPRV